MNVVSLVTNSKIDCLQHTCFLHAGTNSGKLKVDSVIFVVGLFKDDSDLLVHESLKSALSSK